MDPTVTRTIDLTGDTTGMGIHGIDTGGIIPGGLDDGIGRGTILLSMLEVA